MSWWRGERIANDSWGSNHGALVNGATFATGMVGYAFSLDGVNDYISIPHDPSLSFGSGSSMSFDLWMNGTTKTPPPSTAKTG